MTTSVTLAQAAHLVATCGHEVTFIFEGEPGIGKSAMLKDVAATLNMEGRYFDAALPPDAGDLQLPDFTESKEYFSFKPNKLFYSSAPVIIMADEIGKASRPVQNALLPLLLEHRVGSHKLHEGSIVFGATNTGTDGVGDMLQAHARNRVSFIQVRKPTADEWIEWGARNNVDPTVLAWAHEYPHAFESYLDMSADDANANPYIFNPRKQQTAFVTPRSLTKAAQVIAHRKHLPQDALLAAVAGAVGESAARDMEAFISLSDRLTPWTEIIKNPTTVEVPDNPVAVVITALGAVQRLSKDNVQQWMQYLVRLPREVQFLFASTAMRTPKASSSLISNREFTVWAADNAWVF